MIGGNQQLAGTQGWFSRLPRAARIVIPVTFGAGVLISAAGQRGVQVALAIPLAGALILLYVARQYLAVTAIMLVTAIFLDFYQLIAPPLHEPVLWLLLAAALVAALFLAQSRARPWVRVPHLRLWLLLLVVAGLAVPRGSLTETGMYYVTVFVNGLLLYVIGVQVVRSGRDLHWLLTALAAMTAVIAAHSVVQGLTGRFLLATQHQMDYLGSVRGFHLAGTTITRAGSFLENPDWNGAFLAMMLFVPLCLALGTPSRTAKLVYTGLCALDVLALLFTFTTASWLAAACGVALYVAVFVPRRYRLPVLASIGALLVAMAVVFSVQVRLLLAHASAQNEFTLRLGAWATALRAIVAHPLTGLGMAQSIYIKAAEPYRVPWQTLPLAHPHNSYLELAAFAGVPVLVAFLALLAAALRTAVVTYRAAPPELRPLIGGMLAALCTFSVNSLAINGWTLPVLAALGWLLMGAASAPGLRAKQPQILAEKPGDVGDTGASMPQDVVAELGALRGVAPGTGVRA